VYSEAGRVLGQLGYLITLLFYHNHPPIVKKPITETSDEVNRAGGWRYVVPLSSLVVEPDIEHHTVYTLLIYLLLGREEKSRMTWTVRRIKFVRCVTPHSPVS